MDSLFYTVFKDSLLLGRIDFSIERFFMCLLSADYAFSADHEQVPSEFVLSKADVKISTVANGAVYSNAPAVFVGGTVKQAQGLALVTASGLPVLYSSIYPAIEPGYLPIEISWDNNTILVI